MLLEEFIEAAVKPGQKASLFSTETPLININYLPLHGPFKDHRRRHHSDTSSERGTGGGANRRAFVGGGGGGGGSTPWAGTGIFNQGSYGRDGLRLRCVLNISGGDRVGSQWPQCGRWGIRTVLY